MKHLTHSGAPFFALALVFFAIGLNGQKTFMVIAIPFFVLGLASLRRYRNK